VSSALQVQLASFHLRGGFPGQFQRDYISLLEQLGISQEDLEEVCGDGRLCFQLLDVIFKTD